MQSHTLRFAAAAAVLAGMGCTGLLGGSDEKDSVAGSAEEIAVSGARRLTAFEYRTTVRDLVGYDVDDAELVLPTDERTPFDNELTKQTASQALIDGADLLAGEVAEAVALDPALRAAIVPCTPAGASDAACFRSFVSSFGRKALRRPLATDEVDRFATHFLPHAETANDFWIAVDSALRAFLQHPEFLYRIEIGEPVRGLAGVYQLGEFELATRLSYLLWGTTPPDWLLDAAEMGELSDPAQRRSVAEQMLADPRALQHIARFHAMWLSYEQLPHAPEITAGMRQETEALLARYLLSEQRPWSDLLLADETFLTPELAAHYGLPAPADPAGAWVPYGDSGRRGILSHGSFLSAVPKFDDTSPTQRGLLIRTRLFCEVISLPPPELMVNTDEPPGAADPTACKTERYSMWQTDGCKTCHARMDPVGFGLENYDAAGRYREYQTDRPDCPIDGQGTLEGVGTFRGPSELAQLMVDAGGVDACVATMLYRFATGRYQIDEHDEALLERLVAAAQGGQSLRFDKLVAELVASTTFAFRREEVVQ